MSYQRAIEAVYWRHRIWPKENADPKPSLDAVMSQAQLEKKVADYLRKSQALEDYWQRPITAKQLQAKLDRMARYPKQPEILRELFEALGNDPFVIAECLVRPVLAERLLTDWYVYDQRFHGELKKYAEADLQGHNTIKQMKETSGSYNEIEFIRSDSAQDMIDRGASRSVKLNDLDWEETVQRLAAAFNRSDPVKASALRVRRDVAAEYRALPLGQLSPLREDQRRYYVTAVIERADNHLKVATIAWLKEPARSWLAKAEKQVPVTIAAVNTNYTLPGISGQSAIPIPSGGCTDDTWTLTNLSNVPDARDSHSAVWTGTEMIVWGGYPQLNTGGRYDPTPAADTILARTVGQPPASPTHPRVEKPTRQSGPAVK